MGDTQRHREEATARYEDTVRRFRASVARYEEACARATAASHAYAGACRGAAVFDAQPPAPALGDLLPRAGA